MRREIQSIISTHKKEKNYSIKRERERKLCRNCCPTTCRPKKNNCIIVFFFFLELNLNGKLELKIKERKKRKGGFRFSWGQFGVFRKLVFVLCSSINVLSCPHPFLIIITKPLKHAPIFFSLHIPFHYLLYYFINSFFQIISSSNLILNMVDVNGCTNSSIFASLHFE